MEFAFLAPAVPNVNRKAKAPEVRHIMGSNPSQQKPIKHGIGNGIPPSELKIKTYRSSRAYYLLA
jgi:hypothetical protein